MNYKKQVKKLNDAKKQEKDFLSQEKSVVRIRKKSFPLLFFAVSLMTMLALLFSSILISPQQRLAEGMVDNSNESPSSTSQEDETLPSVSDTDTAESTSPSETEDDSKGTQIAEDPGQDQEETVTSESEETTDTPTDTIPQGEEPILDQTRTDSETGEPVESIFAEDPERLTLLLPIETSSNLTPGRASELHFNPLILNSDYLLMLSEFLYRPLYQGYQGGAYSLAHSYEISDDNKTITFSIKDDASWSSGEALTSRDLYFTVSALIQADLAYPWQKFIDKIVGVAEYRLAQSPDFNDDNLAPDTNLPSYETFLRIDGLECPDDVTFTLHFTEDLRPYLGEILRLPAIPVHVWWPYSPDEWLGLEYIKHEKRKIELPQASLDSDPNEEETIEVEDYNGASSGPYIFTNSPVDLMDSLVGNQDEINQAVEETPSDELDSDLRLQTYDHMDGSSFNQANINKLLVRFVSPDDIFTEILRSEADLAVLPSLGEEMESQITDLGYQIDRVPTPKVLTAEFNLRQESNIFQDEDLRLVFYWLSPNPEELQESSNLPIFPMENELRSDLSEKFQKTFQRKKSMSLEDRVEEALDLLLKKGYITAMTDPEKIADATNKNQGLLTFPSFTIYYPQNDPLITSYINLFFENCNLAGIYPQVISVSRQEFEFGHDINTSDVFIDNSRYSTGPENVLTPLYRQGYYFAYKRLGGFEPQNLYYFTGAEDWILVPSH